MGGRCAVPQPKPDDKLANGGEKINQVPPPQRTPLGMQGIDQDLRFLKSNYFFEKIFVFMLFNHLRI